MLVIAARNVNDAWSEALSVLDQKGERRGSRNGDVVVMPYPVTTIYSRPTERALFDPVRDANPIFHLHEALWMLAGRDDATWLDRFVSDFSSRFAEEDGTMHGAYGRRWRDWFERSWPEGTALMGMSPDRMPLDQLDECVRLLRDNPEDRQAVISMWDPSADLGVPGLKDRPCNTQIYLRCDRTEHPRQTVTGAPFFSSISGGLRYLDMTVCCRSNDIVYGCYGANAVHFSVLQEYLAARIGVSVGTYTQVSNNWHMYDWSRARVSRLSADGYAQKPYPGTLPLVSEPEAFDEEVRAYLDEPLDDRPRLNSFLRDTARHMYAANERRLSGDLDEAVALAARIAAPDWRQATLAWLERRGKT